MEKGFIFVNLQRLLWVAVVGAVTYMVEVVREAGGGVMMREPGTSAMCSSVEKLFCIFRRHNDKDMTAIISPPTSACVPNSVTKKMTNSNVLSMTVFVVV